MWLIFLPTQHLYEQGHDALHKVHIDWLMSRYHLYGVGQYDDNGQLVIHRIGNAHPAVCIPRPPQSLSHIMVPVDIPIYGY